MKKSKKMVSLLIIIMLSVLCFSNGVFAYSISGFYEYFPTGAIYDFYFSTNVGSYNCTSTYNTLIFDGNDYAWVWDSSSNNFGTGDFAISCRFKTRSTQSNCTILDKRTYDNKGYHLTLLNGKPCFQMGTSSSNWANFYNSSSSSYNDDEWHYLQVTVDRDSTTGLKMYVDYNLILTMNPTNISGSITNSNDLYIGKHRDSSSYNFFGEIDYVILQK